MTGSGPQSLSSHAALLALALVLVSCGKAPDEPRQDAELPKSPPPVEQPAVPAETGLSPADGTEAQSLAEQVVSPTYTDDLPAIRKRRELRVLVTYSPTDFFIDETGTTRGLQADFLNEYRKVLNRNVKKREKRTRIIYIPTTFDRLIPDLLQGKGDIAAAMLTVTPEREALVAFASGRVRQVDELVVTGKSATGIDSIDDLAGRPVYVVRGSSYAEHLRELNREFAKRGLEPVDIREADSHLLSKDILELVNSGVVDITVVDDFAAHLWAQVLPDIRVLDDVKVSSANTVGWAVRKNNPKLLKSLNSFAAKIKKGTLTGNILFQRYYENTKWIDNPIEQEERKKLAGLLDIFRKYSDQYEFDYLAIAAQAYQESRLDNQAKSHRGAVGIMQILPSTAADPNIDVSDIEQLENNVHAGVKYLAFLRDRYFSDPEISLLDRSAFSWAAYNAGPSNVLQMREQAEKMGLDPNIWFSNVEVAAAKIIGRETVEYVSNIYKYYVAYRLVADRIDAPL